MAANIERLAEEFEKSYPEVAALLRADAQVARKLDVPETFSNGVVPVEVPQNEWERQAYNLANRFAAELGQSRDQYMAGLPKFTDQPEAYKGRFDAELLVQVPTQKLTLARILEIAGVTNYLDLGKVKNWDKDPQKFKTPENIYIAWLHDGSRNKKRSVRDVRASLLADERGGTVYEGLALFIQNPDILKDHYLDLPGSQFGSDYAPSLNDWHGEPKLHASHVDNAYSHWGSVVVGR